MQQLRSDNAVPTIGLKFCDYNIRKKSLSIASEFFGMPSRFAIRSHHTNSLVEFETVKENDPLFDRDQWDGEQQIYRPVVPQKNVEFCIIYNQY